MKHFNGDIGDIMEKSMQQHSSYLSFNTVWSGYCKKPVKKRLFSIPATIFLILFALVATGSAGYMISRIIDKTDYPFIDDPLVTGKWEAVDFVKKPEDFLPGQKTWKGDLYLNALVFIKDGKMLGAFNSIIFAHTTCTWTNGLVLNKQEKTASSYKIKDIDGSSYMFIEWKSGDYSFRNMKPKFYVLKKLDSNDYSDFEPKIIIEDDVDYTFENDEQMIGNWQSVDFVNNMEEYKPNKKKWLGDFYLTEMRFDAGGNLTLSTTESNNFSHPLIAWTRGLVINKLSKTASRCEIREIDGVIFMFYEWKSGDYQYRGMKPSYYVLKKLI
jgi:bla regulator protein blaR1